MGGVDPYPGPTLEKKLDPDHAEKKTNKDPNTIVEKRPGSDQKKLPRDFFFNKISLK